jgi:predicted nucleotidyltransferase
MPSPTVDQISQAVAEWAATEPLIRRVYLYGSRAKGSARPDSDIDLAILFKSDPSIVAEQRGDMFQARWFTWEDHNPRWHADLSRRFSVPVHLKRPQRSNRIVRPALKSCRLRLYPP